MPNASGELVYVLDQDDIVRDSLTALIESHGYSVREFANSGEFLIGSEPGEGVCLVLGFSRYDLDADRMLRHLRMQRPDLPVILVVAQGRMLMAATGAFARLERPLQEATLIEAIRRAEARGRTVD